MAQEFIKSGAIFMTTWIETNGGTKVAQSAQVFGASNILISDNCTICSGCVLHGGAETKANKPSITLGKNTMLHENCTIEPPLKLPDFPGEFVMGNYCIIGNLTVLRLSMIGNRVRVGANCMLGAFTIVNDCCIIDDGTIIPPRMVIPPYSRVSGVPGQDFHIGELSPAYRKVLELDSHLERALFD